MAQNLESGELSYEYYTSFLSFSSPYNAAISSIIVIIIISIVYFILKQFIKTKNKYYSQDYWESRYAMYPKYMDWYCNFEKLCNDFQIDGYLSTYYPNKKKTNIIELGCGNSCLAVDLSKLGYTKITSIDFSNTVIKQMQEKFINEKINCNQFDF